MGLTDRLREMVTPNWGGIPFTNGKAGPGLALARTGFPPPEQKAFIGYPDGFWTFLPGSSPGSADREDVVGRTAYVAAALAYICIQYRARKLVEPPLMVIEETDEGEEWLEEHELNTILARPNPDYAMRRLYERTVIYRDLTGGCLWVKNRDRRGRVADLRAFPKDEVTVEAVGNRQHGRFIINTRTGRRTYPIEDVVYFVNLDPLDEINGAVAPLDAALHMLNIGGSLRVQARNMIRNAIRPTGGFATEETLATDQYDRLKAQIARDHQGAQNAGKWLLLEGGMKWQQIAQSVGDLMPQELIAWVEATVCACFQLHPALLGIKSGLENSPWSHLETAQKMLYQEMCLPLWAADEEVLTEALLREVDQDPAHLIRFDTSRIPALQEDVDTKIEKRRHAYPYMRVDEVRQSLGLDPIGGPEGDVRYVPVGWIEAGALANGGAGDELDPELPL